jgi:origin recognition complex subunit 2
MPRLIAAGQEERWRKLRDEAIYHFFLRRYKKGGGTDSDLDDESDDGSLGPATAGWGGRKRGKGNTKENADDNNSKPIRSRSNKNASVTTADAGADLFFNKGTRKARQSRRAKQILANQKTAKKIATTDGGEDNTMPFERLSLEECAEKVKDFDLDEVPEHEKAYREQFGEWRFLLTTNHSLMCYGFGSKFNLLNDFAQQELSKEGYTMILNGFDPGIKVEAILTLLVDLFLDGNEPPPHLNSIPGYEEEDVIKMDTVKKDKQSGKMKPITVKKARDPMERAKAIARAVAKTQAKELYPIFLVIHNLEGFGLRNRLAQETIASLVAYSKVKHCGVNAIRLVASVDHVDAPAMLWNASTMALYSWIWKDVHTYRPYVQELVMLSKEEINTSSSKKRRSSGGAGKRQQAHLLIDGEGANKVTKVLQNLANRYTEVIQILATLQLEAQATAPKQHIHWVDEARLLQQCLNKCTVKSAPQLRTFLNELKDHELVVVQTQGSTSLMVRVPYTEEKLHEILAFRPDKNAGQ